jgi:CYTH domain-containing protein
MTNNTTIEYELTYLARELPAEIHSSLPTRVVDFYVAGADSDHPVLRLRRKGDKYEITKKTIINGTDSSAQTEQTIPLTSGEFESLASGQTRIVEKDRYAVTIGGHPAEVDVFSGKLEGLVMIDFEFDHEADKAAFEPPACCLADVTQELFAAGGELSGKSYADIVGDLKRYDYKPLSL